MNHLIELAIGLGALLLGTAIIAAFRARQLYLVIPKMLGHGGLTGKGQIVQLQVFNRSRAMEEDVRIFVPKTLTADLVAADNPDVSLANNIVILSRLPPFSDATAILLVEGPVQTDLASTTIASKTSKGKLLKTVGEVRPNFGALIIIFAVMAFLFVGEFAYFQYDDAQRERHRNEAKQEFARKYDFLTSSGWEALDSYDSSTWRKSYSDKEFPVSLVSATGDKSSLELTFSIANKSARPITFSAFFMSDKKEYSNSYRFSERPVNVFDSPVSPLTAATIKVSLKGLHSDFDVSTLYVQMLAGVADYENCSFRFRPSHNAAAVAAAPELFRAHHAGS
jgi:hypothetical protein